MFPLAAVTNYTRWLLNPTQAPSLAVSGQVVGSLASSAAPGPHGRVTGPVWAWDWDKDRHFLLGSVSRTWVLELWSPRFQGPVFTPANAWNTMTSAAGSTQAWSRPENMHF